jgi:hypothetical protein
MLASYDYFRWRNQPRPGKRKETKRKRKWKTSMMGKKGGRKVKENKLRRERKADNPDILYHIQTFLLSGKPGGNRNIGPVPMIREIMSYNERGYHF